MIRALRAEDPSDALVHEEAIRCPVDSKDDFLYNHRAKAEPPRGQDVWICQTTYANMVH